MRAVDVFLRQIDEAWRHEWESLMPVLEGVTDDEASWQAPCYREEPAESDWPAPGTIYWHVVHIAECKQAYTAHMRGAETGPFELAGSFAADVEQLKRIHRVQREAIASLSDDDLEKVLTNDTPLGEYLTSTIRHDTWHAAQIAVARRLWRTRK